MAGKFEFSPAVTPSPTCSSSEFQWPMSWGNLQAQVEYFRSVSDQQATPRRPQENQSCLNFHTALRCKQSVGTKEWVNCKQRACVELRHELHHLLECPYRHLGGCRERCIHLREELVKFREHHPKYPTVADAQLQSRLFLQKEELQVQLQALHIEEYLKFSTYSPTSPDVQEPFRLPVETEGQESFVGVTELIPLDKTKLSVSAKGYRKRHEWRKICFLGNGTFGSTYLCYDNLRSYHFAIKKLPVKSFDEDEINIWQKLTGKHPNILDLYGALQRKERVLIFMEYMNGGSVADYLAKNSPFNERNSLSILQQVLSGLDFMHRCRIIHGDVKGANILMDDLCLHIKIADFGSCVDLNVLETSGRFRLAGTLAFMAPEVCRSEAPSPSSDIWSAMCLLIQMLSGKPPWEDYRHQGDGLLFVIGSAKRPPMLPECSKLIQDMFAKGLNVNGSARPTAAEFLRHRAFNLIGDNNPLDESILYDEDDSESDTSTEYHSSVSPDFDTSGEYFSSDDFHDKFCPSDSVSLRKANSPNVQSSKAKHVDSKGGQVRTPNAQITIPPEALQSDTKVSISSVDPGDFYQPILDNDIEDQVTILGNVYKLRPSGLTFRENVSVTVNLPDALHQSEDIMVLHGCRDRMTNKFLWQEIKKTLLPFQDSTVVTVDITHFSVLLFAKILPSFACEYMITYLNYQTSWFRIIVFICRDESNQERLKIRIILVRDSFYLNTSQDLYEKYFIGHKLKEEGFLELHGSRREYFVPKEKIEVSIEGLEGGSVVSPQSHVVENIFGGEEIASWEVVERAPTGGTVVFKRSAGQKYRFQFWEHEPTRYVQDELGLSTLRHTNMLPLARALSLSHAEVNDLVEATGGDEEEQLRRITDMWKTKAENNELPQLRKFAASVPPEELLVSDRGKSHLSHLLEFRQKDGKRRNSGTPPLGEDLYFHTTAKNAENLCQSVCSDCVLQNDHSEEKVQFVSTDSNLVAMMKEFSEIVRQNYSETVSQNVSALVVAFEKYENDKSSTSTCQHFRQQLSGFIPWLMQIVKDLFKVHPISEPTGMWGLPNCESELLNSDAGQEQKNSSKILVKISKILKDLCMQNSTDSALSSDLELWYKEVSLGNFLNVLTINHKGWSLLAARIRYYHLFKSEIMNDKFSRVHQQDLENLLQSLRNYASFSPTRLVRFNCFGVDVQREPLHFESENTSFVQKFVVSMSENSFDLTVEVKVCIRGVVLSDNVDVTLRQCEQQDDDIRQCCKTLIVDYQHSGNQGGRFKIFNECRALFEEKYVTVPAEPEEADGSPTSVFKEGSPDLTELHEIAKKVNREWNKVGLKLLSNDEVNVIDEDERRVVEKATAMFEKWKQVKGSSATYEVLYDALVFAERNDIAEEFCLVNGGRTL